MNESIREPTKQEVKVTAIWLRRIGDHAQVLIECEGQWKLVAQERFDGNFSHIAEARGLTHWPNERVNLTAGGEIVCG